jgi:transcriptional regulator with XRE-family HTH domain
VAGADDAVRQQLEALGGFIRAQRHQAQLTLRELAARTNVSNPYLSQIERGLHEPSVRVLKAISVALNVSLESLLVAAGLLSEEGGTAEGTGDAGRVAAAPLSTEAAIAADPRLTEEQRATLLAVLRSYVTKAGD